MRYASLIQRSLPRPFVGFLTLCAAISTLWIGLGVSLVWGASYLSHQWDQRFTQTTLVVIPTNTTRDLHPLLTELSQLHGVSNVQSLSSDDITRLLTQWGASWPRPAPAIIALTGEASQPDLEKVSKHFSPDATLITPPPPNEGWLSFSRTITASSTELSVLSVFSSFVFFTLTLLQAWRSTRLAQQQGFTLLSHLGCPFHRGYGLSVRRFACASFIGSILGVLVLFPLLYTLVRTLSPLVHQPAPSNLLSFATSLGQEKNILCLLPLFYGLYGWVISWMGYRITTRHLP